VHLLAGCTSDRHQPHPQLLGIPDFAATRRSMMHRSSPLQRGARILSRLSDTSSRRAIRTWWTQKPFSEARGFSTTPYLCGWRGGSWISTTCLTFAGSIPTSRRYMTCEWRRRLVVAKYPKLLLALRIEWSWLHECLAQFCTRLVCLAHPGRIGRRRGAAKNRLPVEPPAHSPSPRTWVPDTWKHFTQSVTSHPSTRWRRFVVHLRIVSPLPFILAHMGITML